MNAERDYYIYILASKRNGTLYMEIKIDRKMKSKLLDLFSDMD